MRGIKEVQVVQLQIQVLLLLLIFPSFITMFTFTRISSTTRSFSLFTSSSTSSSSSSSSSSSRTMLRKLSRNANHLVNMNMKTNINTNSNEKGNDNGNENEKEKEEDEIISFEWESFDKKGQWMTIDYDNIPIDRNNIANNNNNNNNNNNKVSSDTTSSTSASTPSTSTTSTTSTTTKQSVFSPQQHSPIEIKLIKDKLIYIKRDDLLHLRNSNVSGNKARKMLSLNELRLRGDEIERDGDENDDDDENDENGESEGENGNDVGFPDVIVSYGGPQSNAMVALAAIVQSKNVELERLDRLDTKSSSSSSSSSFEKEHMDEIESDDWIIRDEDEFNKKRNDDYDNDDDYNNAKTSPSTTSSTSTSTSTTNKRFVYYTKKLPRYLRNQPNGNLLRALSLGMELVQLKHDTYNDLFGGDHGGSSTAPLDVPVPVPGSSLWVPQGGACGLASQGAKLMAEEIVSYWMTQQQKQNQQKRQGIPLSVCVPGGTCTTAMLLSREINAIIRDMEREETHDSDTDTDTDNQSMIIPIDIEVVVIPCVGDAAYAMRQMKALDISTGGNGRDDIPHILKPIRRRGYFRFGEPNAEILKTFFEMRDEYGVYLDLLYGAPAWNIILQHWNAARYDYYNYESPIKDRQFMYVHSGGLEGVSSQLTRYKHKGLIDSGQVQN